MWWNWRLRAHSARNQSHFQTQSNSKNKYWFKLVFSLVNLWLIYFQKVYKDYWSWIAASFVCNWSSFKASLRNRNQFYKVTWRKNIFIIFSNYRCPQITKQTIKYFGSDIAKHIKGLNSLSLDFTQYFWIFQFLNL